MRKKKLFLLLLVLWIVFITVLSLISTNNFSKVSVKGADTFVHFCFYFVLTVLLVFNFINSFNFNRAIFISIVVAIIYGMIIELLQGALTSSREPEIKDVLLNSFGSVAAAILLFQNRERLNFLK